MAKARMLHNKISKSLDVNKLDLEAQLLFTWLISHADDEGRLRGEPEYVKAAVVPMKLWTFEDISKYLIQMKNLGLIHYWDKDGIKIIEFTKWKDHQTIRSDRFTPSSLPTHDNQLSTKLLPSDNQITAQDNKSEARKEKVKKSELNKPISEFEATSGDEYAAIYAWKALEPENKTALQTTYLNAVRKGIRAGLIFQFVSEIKHDHTVKNPGQVFNKKVNDYKLKEDDKS